MSFLKISALATAAFMLTGTALAQQFTIETGKSKTLRLKSDATNVSLGNQNVAEVAVLERDLLLISGKSFGTTNLIVFGAGGDVIYSGDLVVTTNTANLLTINRAGSNFTYNCAPECRQTIQLGDNPEFFGTVIEQLQSQKDLNE